MLPLQPRGKRPILTDWTNTASSDPDVIAEWAEEHPTANVGLLTGEKFWVLDIDPAKGGAESLAALESQHGPLPATWTQRTGSGGTHYLFSLPEGATVSNTVDRVGKGVDTRGVGGQIVAAPSSTEKGPYSWINGPWGTVPLASAPAWLLDRVASKTSTVSAESSRFVSAERGHFPPASPEVIAAARAALDRHGPAIEGNGGDQHTFVACSMLSHDFALTEDEAFPLLLEWNDECQPPWSEDDLHAKLRGSERYASGPYGSKRTMDAREIAFKMISDWRAEPDGNPTRLAERVRDLTFGDPTDRAQVMQALQDATGMQPKALAIPGVRVDPGSLPAGTILVSPRLAEVGDEATKAIAPHVYQRGGMLCEIVRNERTTIFDLETARIQDLMSRSSKFVRVDPERGYVEQAAPMPVAQILHARRTHENVRVLESVTTAPIFLADGSILSEAGYNAAARVYLDPSVSVFVDDEPTHDDAVFAIARLYDVVDQFKFLTPADFASWLACLLSPLVKSATNNAVSPLFCVSAASPGAGKSLLINVICRIITGGDAENRSYTPRDPGEWTKKITSFVRAASPVSVLDNVNGVVGDETLDRLITSSVWSDRILGATNAPALPNVSTWIATGNNIEPHLDTVRRAAMVRIDVDSERPAERSGWKYDPLLEHVSEHRSQLLSAALTLLRAYHVAGRPPQRLPAWGSFEVWSALVRGALVWAGCADPFETQRRVSSNANETEHEGLDLWIAAVGSAEDGTAASVAAGANALNAREVLALREDVTAHNVRKLIARYVDKVRAGKRIRKDLESNGRARYYVEHVR